MSAYTVGQILYLLQTKNFSVVPVQVAEQITKNTLDGSETVYNVKIPGKDTMLDLSSFEGDVFDNLPDVKNHMLKNVTQNIEKMISGAAEIASQYFPDAPEPKSPFSPETITNEQFDQIKVELEDGQLANVRLPPEFRDPPQ